MVPVDVAELRLRNTGLSDSPFRDPAAVIAHLGAVQAQDFAAAKWSLGLRIREATDETVEAAFNEGRFVRTHVMRPTWHFVLPQDVRWMQELTAPRVRRALASSDRRLGITEEIISRSGAVLAEALEGRNYLTRNEISIRLEKDGIHMRGQRLAHLLVHAELSAQLCSGPRRGKQFTYALLDERAPEQVRLSREESLELLATRYFMSHGPAHDRG
jgi:hypothetical protein